MRDTQTDMMTMRYVVSKFNIQTALQVIAALGSHPEVREGLFSIRHLYFRRHLQHVAKLQT